MKAIELFSGAGGLSLGAKAAGVECLVAIEKDQSAAKTYSQNFPKCQVFNQDITKVCLEEVRRFVEPEILLAGPPCQAFSTSNQKTRTDSNPQNALLIEPIRFVSHFRPKIAIVENVHGLSIGTRKEHLRRLIELFEKIKYNVQVLTVIGTDVGLPQKRTRLFVVATQQCLQEIKVFSNNKKIYTVKDAIADLPKLRNGDSPDFSPYGSLAQSEYAETLRGNMLCCDGHLVTNNDQKIIERYSYIPQGGNWKSIPRHLLQNYSNVDRCHTGIYHRLSWNLPGKVLGNFRKNMLIHPDQDRGLSVREAARLQSFPDNFSFVGSIGKKQQQVGNAVPPIMAETVISAVLNTPRK